MKSDLNRNQHSVYKLTYHLVLVIKYRRKVINQDIFDFLMDIFSDIGDKYDVEIVESNWDVDYIHVFFDAASSTNLVKFINAYKSASSRSIKRDYPQIKRFLWKSAFLENRLFHNHFRWSKYSNNKKIYRRPKRKIKIFILKYGSFNKI